MTEAQAAYDFALLGGLFMLGSFAVLVIVIKLYSECLKILVLTKSSRLGQ